MTYLELLKQMEINNEHGDIDKRVKAKRNKLERTGYNIRACCVPISYNDDKIEYGKDIIGCVKF